VFPQFSYRVYIVVFPFLSECSTFTIGGIVLNYASSFGIESLINPTVIPSAPLPTIMVSDSKAPVETTSEKTSVPTDIPDPIESAKVSYRRTQRFLSLCDRKIAALENDPEAFEEMPVRDFRNLVRCVQDLEKAAHAYAEVIHGEGSPAETAAAPSGKAASPTTKTKDDLQEKLMANPLQHPIFGKKHGKKHGEKQPGGFNQGKR
jgi:hypothetical protein